MTDPPLLLLVSDLFFVSKIGSSARACGVATRTVLRGEDAVGVAVATGARGAVVDLDDDDLDALAAVGRLRAEPRTAPLRIVGYFSHARPERRERALASGCDEAIPRSKFSAELPFFVRALAAGRPV